VSPITAVSLVRALQTSHNSHDYRIPPAGNDLEISDDEFRLLGWIKDNSSDPRIDEKDAYKNDVRMVESEPSDSVIKSLDLTLPIRYPLTWLRKLDPAFIYEAWSDLPADSRNREHLQDGEVISDGHRLNASPKSLNDYLNCISMDLIIEIEITKRIGEYEYRDYDEEPKNEARYSRIYLFKRTGEIHSVDGCIGTWLSPNY
jgi:hypothetical protein